VALLTLCLIFVQGRAHQPQQWPATPPVAQASRAWTAPVVDGRIPDDPAWQGVPALVDFWQTAPDAGQPSSEHIEVRIVYTDTRANTWSSNFRFGWLQQANTGVFVVDTIHI
jgi:hypothetical protein